MSDLKRRKAKWTYDDEADAYYVYLRGDIPDGGVARTKQVTSHIDLDEKGRIIGIELVYGLADVEPPE